MIVKNYEGRRECSLEAQSKDGPFRCSLYGSELIFFLSIRDGVAR